MKRHEKCTEDVRVHMSETLKSDLKVQAAIEGYESLSPFIKKICREYLYGHHITGRRDLLAETIRDE